MELKHNGSTWPPDFFTRKFLLERYKPFRLPIKPKKNYKTYQDGIDKENHAMPL